MKWTHSWHDKWLHPPTFIDLRTFSVGLAGFSAFLHLYATQSLLPLFTRVFHAPQVEVSLTVSATTIAVALMAPLVGLFADLIGRKRIIVAAVLGLSVPTFLAATSPGLSALVGWRFCQGLLMPAIFAVTLAYISEEWASGGMAATMAAYVTGNILGGVSGRFLAGLIAAQMSWRWAFIILGGLNLVCGLVIGIGLPPARQFIRQNSLVELLRASGQHLRNPQLLVAYGVGFNVLFSMVATFTYVNFYLAAPPFLLGTAALGSIFLVYLLGVIVTPVAGQWLERLGYRTTLALALVAASQGVLLTLTPRLGVVITGLAICAAGIFVSQSAANSYLGSVASQARSLAAGLYVACYYAGGSTGAIIPGLLWPLGGWSSCVVLIVIMQLVTASLALRFWRC
jgi:MFS transporter, YNFM family, putative membrane transport protein